MPPHNALDDLAAQPERAATAGLPATMHRHRSGWMSAGMRCRHLEEHRVGTHPHADAHAVYVEQARRHARS